MVSTRQMSITTIGPEAGSSGVNTSTHTGSSRMASNSLSQQSTNNSTARHQQPNNNPASPDPTHSNTNAVVPAYQIQLTDLPLEIFERIFQYTGYKEVSNMRLVSTHTNQICKTILNSTFTKLQTQLIRRFENIKKIMPRRESARRAHPLYYECDIIETCCMRLSLLQMTFGRYIEHKHICFFPGAFLDEVYNVLNDIRTTPNLGRPFKVTEELIDLSTMAMEYFKDHLEPSMPQFFGKSSTATRAASKNCYVFDTSSSANSVSTSTRSSQSSSMPSPPQSNMVLRKGIRKIKQGMKKYNNQLSVLRTDLRFCKRKSTDQAKQITELQNMLAEQQKQTLEYLNRLDENDKKSEEMSSKISTLLQELNKCKNELHYYRSKSPATPICNNCGQTTLTIPPGNLLALMKHNNINSSRDEIINVIGKCSNFELESKVQSHESSISEDLTVAASATDATATTMPKTITINTMMLMHSDDNKDSLDKTSCESSSEPISPMLSSSTSVGVTNITTPINGYIDNLEKRLKLARHKVNHNMAEWRCSSSDKTNIIEDNLTCDSTQTTALSSSSLSSLSSSTSSSSSPSSSSSSSLLIAQSLPIASASSVAQATTEQPTKQKPINGSNSSVILTVGTPRFYGKRKLDDSTTSNDTILNMPGGGMDNTSSLDNPIATSITNKSNAMATNNLANSNLSDNYNKKARRVQNKLKIQLNMNIKTRNK